MKANKNKGDYFWLVYAAINFALAAAVVAVGLVSFFASLEIVLTLGAHLIWGSIGDTVQGKYALATIRNIWLLAGGMLFLVVIIYCINYFFKHWNDRRLHRVYIKFLVVEALIILLSQALSTA